jgi:hypothetical protein
METLTLKEQLFWFYQEENDLATESIFFLKLLELLLLNMKPSKIPLQNFKLKITFYHVSVIQNGF